MDESRINDCDGLHVESFFVLPYDHRDRVPHLHRGRSTCRAFISATACVFVTTAVGASLCRAVASQVISRAHFDPGMKSAPLQ